MTLVCLMAFWVPLLGAPALAPGTSPDVAAAATAPAATRASADSSLARRAPFVPASDSRQPFAASELTRKYTKNLVPFLSPLARPASLDLEQVEHLAQYASLDTATADSSRIRLVHGAALPELSPAEKEKLKPKQPGAHVPIPSPVAATAALLGGLGLLIKLITELAR